MIDLLNPSSLTITNDSWKHRHHHAMQEVGGGNGETRMFADGHTGPADLLNLFVDFSIQVVSDAFKGKASRY